LYDGQDETAVARRRFDNQKWLEVMASRVPSKIEHQVHHPGPGVDHAVLFLRGEETGGGSGRSDNDLAHGPVLSLVSESNIYTISYSRTCFLIRNTTRSVTIKESLSTSTVARVDLRFHSKFNLLEEARWTF